MNNKALFTAIIVASCSFSFDLKKEIKNPNLLVGTWEVQDYIFEDIDVVPVLDEDSLSITFVFDMDGDFTENVNLHYTDDGEYYSYDYLFDGRWSIEADGDLLLDFNEESEGAKEFDASFANYYEANYGVFKEKYRIIEISNTHLKLETNIDGIPVKMNASKR